MKPFSHNYVTIKFENMYLLVAMCDPHKKGPKNTGNKLDKKCSIG